MPRRRLTGSEWADRWQTGSQAKSQNYVEGILATDVNPMQLAKAKLDKAKLEYNRAIDSGKMARGLDRATQQDWKDGATAAGGSAWSSGISNKAGKASRRADDFLPVTYAIADEVNRMPDDTPQQRDAKALAYIQKRRQASERAGTGRR